MDIKIPEREAYEILQTYTGANNYILDMKDRSKSKHYKLTRKQANYIIDNKYVVPKVARKWVDIDHYYGEQLMEENYLVVRPEKVWVEKILITSNKSFHVWGKITEQQELHSMWLPKSQVIPSDKEIENVDYSLFSHRPPFDHQMVAVEKLIANDKYILADDMGLGKTGSAIMASIICKSEKILVVCPASLKLNWKREIEHYSDEPVGIVDGKKWEDGKYVIINYDILKNFHLVPKGRDDHSHILKQGFDLVIIDEAHYVSNTKAKRTKLINHMVSKINRLWLLTGTPMTSRPMNYYNLLNLVESRVAKNWIGYVTRYCDGHQFTAAGGRKIWNTSGASNLEELRDRTKQKVLRRLKSEAVDLPDKIITPIYQYLSSKAYHAEMGNYRIWTRENRDSGLAMHLSKLMRVRQIIADEKIELTCDLINQSLEQDKKVIVFTNFTDPLMKIHERFKDNSVVLHGSMKKENRQESVDKFQTDPNVKIFISNLRAGGVGITLTEAEVVIMSDLSFVPSEHSQAEDRAFRIGQKKNVSILYPIYENTIELAIYRILEKKKNIIDTVMGDNMGDEDVLKEILGGLSF